MRVGDRVRRLPGGSQGGNYPVVGQIYTVLQVGPEAGRILIDGYPVHLGAQYFELAEQRPKYSVYLSVAIPNNRLDAENKERYISQYHSNNELGHEQNILALGAMNYTVLAKKKITFELDYPQAVPAPVVEEEPEDDLEDFDVDYPDEEDFDIDPDLEHH